MTPIEQAIAILREVNAKGVRCDECSSTHWMHQQVEKAITLLQARS